MGSKHATHLILTAPLKRRSCICSKIQQGNLRLQDREVGGGGVQDQNPWRLQPSPAPEHVSVAHGQLPFLGRGGGGRHMYRKTPEILSMTREAHPQPPDTR